MSVSGRLLSNTREESVVSPGEQPKTALRPLEVQPQLLCKHDKNSVSLAVQSMAEDYLESSGQNMESLADLAEICAQALDDCFGRNPPPQPLACAAGCAWCCCNQVRVTLPETLSILRFIEKRWPESRQKHLLATGQKILACINRLAPINFPRDLPCIFLQDGICRIYEVRPLVCRSWHSLDKNQCRKAFESRNPLAMIRQYADRMTIGADVARGLCLALKNKETIHGDIFLPQAIIPMLDLLRREKSQHKTPAAWFRKGQNRTIQKLLSMASSWPTPTLKPGEN